MNPITALLPIPASNSPSYNESYDGNIQLMEARYLELLSSLRALDRSMKEIREYIITQIKENDNDDNDIDCFIDAIKENAILFTKQRHELYNIINGMNNLNFKNVLDIPDDILTMDIEVDVNKFVTNTTATTTNDNDNDKDKVEDKKKTKEKKNQNYVFTAATIDDTVIVDTRGEEDNNNNNNDDDNNSSGVYL